ncbi:MAG: ATP-binding protein [Clostridium sp.]|nr:ATP-binding protein [Clostridium sp.]
MNKLICLAGIPGAGKSAYAEIIGYSIVSSDKVRSDLYGNQECYYNEEVASFLVREKNISIESLSAEEIKKIKEKLCLDYVFEETRKRTCDLLRTGESVVYDSTNLMARFRMDILRAAKGLYDICELHYLNTPLETALARNENRKYVIDPVLIREMYKSQQLPTYEEGFDHIYEVYASMDIILLEKGMVIYPLLGGKEIL